MRQGHRMIQWNLWAQQAMCFLFLVQNCQSVEPWCFSVRLSVSSKGLPFLWSVFQRVDRICLLSWPRQSLCKVMKRVWKIRLLSLTPTSGCLDIGHWFDTGSLHSWESVWETSQHPLQHPVSTPYLQWAWALPLLPGKGPSLPASSWQQKHCHDKTRRLYEALLTQGRSHSLLSKTHCAMELAVGVTSCRSRALFFYNPGAAYGFPVNFCVCVLRSVLETASAGGVCLMESRIELCTLALAT